MQPAGDFLQAGCQIDGRADAGEIEPVAAADIAEQNFSDMQRHPETEALDGFADRVMHRIHAGAGFPRGLQHVAAHLLGVAYRFRDRKHRQQAVAHKLQHFPAMGLDRMHLTIKILVENIHHGLGRQPVRKRGEAAQIRQPDRGLHGIGVAAANLPAENPLAGAVAHISVEQVRSGAGQVHDLDYARQRPHQHSQRGQFVIAETARLFRAPARSVN